MQARRLLDAGAVAKAGELFARVEQLCEQAGFRDPCAWYWARDAITTYLALGRREDAQRVISWLEASGPGLPCRWPRIAAQYGRAALAEADGDLDAADRHHRAALGVHEQVELPLEHIETLLAYGTFLRRRRQPGQARPVLADAFARAENLGAVRLATKAAEELKAAGGRRGRRRSTHLTTQLTTQEARVARLAASGLSNQDIAAAMFVSPKTVEYHLGHVFTKLGLHSRRELIVRATQHGLTLTAT